MSSVRASDTYQYEWRLHDFVHFSPSIERESRDGTAINTTRSAGAPDNSRVHYAEQLERYHKRNSRHRHWTIVVAGLNLT